MDYTIKARPTVYRGQQMRSRLEAKFAQRCDELRILWEYEPVCFAGPSGQYLPDFKLTVADVVVYVDVKPTERMARDVVDGPMRIVWESGINAVLVSFWQHTSPYEGDRWRCHVAAPPIGSWERLLRTVGHECTDMTAEDRYTIHGANGNRLTYLDLCHALPYLVVGDRWNGRPLQPVADDAWHLVGGVSPVSWAPRLIELDRDLIVTDTYRGQHFITHEAEDLFERIMYARKS